MTQREHSPEEKAAVLAALMIGQSVAKTARQFKVPRTTVIRWRDAAGLAERTVSDTKKAEIDDLVGVYLHELLDTLAVQARQFRDKAWLEKQPASEVAVLHGVMADKAFRILAAAEVATDEPEQSSDVS